MQFNKTFYASIKTLNKKTIKFGLSQVNNVNDLYNVSFVKETSLFFSYQHRENLYFTTFSKQEAVVPFNQFSLVQTFVNYAATSFVRNGISYKNTAKFSNVSTFAYCLFFIQLLGFFGLYKSKEFPHQFSAANYFSYRYILQYLTGQIKNNSFSFTRRDRFLYQSVLFSISHTNQFRGIAPAFVNLLNKFFRSTKKKAFGIQQKRRSSVAKLVFFSVTNYRRNPLFTKRFANSTNKSVIPSRFQTLKLTRKQFSFKKAGNRLVTSYPRGYEAFDSKVKKAKKTKKAPFEASTSIVSFKGSSGFQKSQFVEVKPYSYTLKLFATNQNKGQTSYYGFNRLKSLLTLVYGNRLSIYALNARTLSRFAFDKELYGDYSASLAQFHSKSNIKPRVKTSYRFLRSLERERLSRFRYVAVYIQDLIRICFFSIFLKKSAFLVSFFAFTLSKLPRNRKETQFLRFLRKLVKVFASQRKEVIGIRIRFQGRVNRWRRTKHIIGEKGSIAFYTYSTCRDYGRAQAITRKGALGIRFWIAYRSFFSKQLRQTILQYLQLPKRSVIKKYRHFITLHIIFFFR